MAAALSPPSELNKKGKLVENWRQWRQNFEIYIIAAQVNVKDDNTTRALFLHTIGQYGRDIYNNITSLQPPKENSLLELYEMFENYCNPKSNLTYNRYKFFHTNQAKNESFDKFLASLQQQSRDCKFGDLNSSLLVTQIISGIKNITLRERLLKIEMDLNEVIEECRVTEKSELQAQKMSNTNNMKPQLTQIQPHVIQAKPKQDKKSFNKDKSQKGKNESWEKVDVKHYDNCKFCGFSHSYGKCPAFGTVCKKCTKPNHFAKVCKN